MAAQRSPNYPRVDLATCLELIKKLYEREKLAPFPLESAAAAWGNSVKSGAVRYRLGSLRQFGLITRGSAESQLTERALTLLIRTPGSREHQTALRESALTPKLFREIHDTRLDASAETLAHYLIANRRFTPDGADRFIKSFRVSMEIAELTGDGTLDGMDDYNFEEEGEDGSIAETLRSHVADGGAPNQPVAPVPTSSPVQSVVSAAPEGFITLPLPLDAQRVITLTMPIQMDKAEWERFDRMLSGYRPLNSE